MFNSVNHNLIAPLGAGDLIDRAVRLYRQNLLILIRIAAVPVVVAAIGSVLTTLGWRGFYTTSAEAWFAVYTLLLLCGITLQAGGVLLTIMAMGGAARNLVRHLLWGEAVSVRETFRSVKNRFWGLLGASVLIGLLLFVIGIVCFYGGLILVVVAFGITAIATMVSPLLGLIVGIVSTAAALFAALWLFFLLAGKFAYVPQVLLVENQGVFASIGRSASLASGNWRRFGALILFSVFAAGSALMVLYAPLIWFADASGIPVFDFDRDAAPLWYSIAMQLITQLSFILLAPVWMLGLSLMYVDERVRHEAYDIELMAARTLGEMPPLANPSINPLRPALGAQQQLPIERAPTNIAGSTFNLR